MAEFNEEGYDLDNMTSEEKDELIQKLAPAYNLHQVVNASMYNAMMSLASALYAGDVLGHRARTMRIVAWKLATIAKMSMDHVGWDIEKMQVDSQFEDIASGMNFEEGDDEPDESPDSSAR